MVKISTAEKVAQELKRKSAELKAFRSSVAKLKKKGLLDKKYDARSVTPTKYLKSQVKKFAPVLMGEAQPVKVSKEKISYYREQGYETKAGRVVVPVAKNEKVYATRGDFRVKTTGEFGSITRIDLGIKVDKISQWENELMKLKPRLRDGDSISFQLFGHNAYRSFSKVEQAIDYLNHYASYEKAKYEGSTKDQREYISHIVMYRVERDSSLPPEQPNLELEAYRREKQAFRKQAWINSMTPEQHAQYLKRRAESEKKRRSRMSESQKEEAKQKAKERAKKSYNKRTGK